jgi:hypothetical protein
MSIENVRHYIKRLDSVIDELYPLVEKMITRTALFGIFVVEFWRVVSKLLR